MKQKEIELRRKIEVEPFVTPSDFSSDRLLNSLTEIETQSLKKWMEESLNLKKCILKLEVKKTSREGSFLKIEWTFMISWEKNGNKSEFLFGPYKVGSSEEKVSTIIDAFREALGSEVLT